MKIVLFGWSLLLMMTCGASAAGTNSMPAGLATMQASHPRLLATAGTWDSLRDQRRQDARLDQLLSRIESAGRETLKAPVLARKMEGKRLLAVSREALNRVMVWAFCYRLTGDGIFLERAKTELLDLAAFPDWNPSHFLDVAEMTTAMAIGYDWLYAGLDPSARGVIRQAIIEKGLRPALVKNAGYNSWQQRSNNWNQVCFAGLTLGALAVADEEPAVARDVLSLARQNIGNGLSAYVPDGVYPEGPGYWSYGTTYQVLMIAALESALGDSWNLAASPGFLASAEAQLELTGPTGKPYNYSDGGESGRFQPSLFWFAERQHLPGLLFFQWPQLDRLLARSGNDKESGRFLPLVALWWNHSADSQVPPHLPLAWLGDGENPVGVFRDSWTDTNALYLAFKGGAASLSHGHMDAGSFIFEADGVRWACDLGSQDYYSIEKKGWDPFSHGQNAKRWRIYRFNNFSHNTLTLDGQLHVWDADARIVEFNPSARTATVDLTKIFSGPATNVVRHFAIGTNRTVIIRDELSGLKPGEPVRWQMVTHAEVTVAGDHAGLQQAGKSLAARLLSPAGAVFAVAPADPPDNGVNAPNPNTRILSVTARAPADGRLRIQVSLQPE